MLAGDELLRHLCLIAVQLQKLFPLLAHEICLRSNTADVDISYQISFAIHDHTQQTHGRGCSEIKKMYVSESWCTEEITSLYAKDNTGRHATRVQSISDISELWWEVQIS